ncbi:MAG: glycosyltransferase [Candidatus Binatia bacterium]
MLNKIAAENHSLSLIWRYRIFIKYCFVGCFVTGVDFALFSVGFYALRLGAVGSKLIAFSGAVMVSYALNRAWTFRSRNKKVGQQFSRFLTVSVVGAGLSSVGIYLLIDILAVHPLLANGITSGLVLSWNFLANKYWTFRVGRQRARFQEELPLKEVSIVIPAYNEEHRLGETLRQDIAYLSERDASWEIIVVDDGSQDQTASIAQSYVNQSSGHVRLLRLPRNRGKGAAVQLGVMNAVGRYIIIADADNATPIEEVGRFLAEAKENEILIGSRYVESANIEQTQSKWRVRIGRAGNLLIRFFLLDGIADTQCGFKLFPAAIAKELFSKQRIDRWGFDMEILSIAQGLGIPIREKGVTWRDIPGSRLRPLRDAIKTLWELAAIKINLWSGIYE